MSSHLHCSSAGAGLYTVLCPGLEITDCGILICKDNSGRPSGEAFVELASEGETSRAVEKNNENMGHRWGALITVIARNCGWVVSVLP